MNITAERDTEGYLFNPNDWDRDIAIELAREEQIELNNTYWLILDFMRQYYSEHNITPDVRHLINHLASVKNCKKPEAKKVVFTLFPYGYVKQACKIAGMRKPRAWSTG